MSDRPSIPDDIKKSIGRIYIMSTLTTEPALLLRLTRSLMSSIAACHAKLSGDIETAYDAIPNWQIYRSKLDTVTIAYADNAANWPDVMIACADVQDYFLQVALLDDLILIEEEIGIDVMTAFARRKDGDREEEPDDDRM